MRSAIILHNSSKYLLKSMPTLRDPLPKCLSIFLRSSERRKIEEEHVSLLIKRFPQVVQTENLQTACRVT